MIDLCSGEQHQTKQNVHKMVHNQTGMLALGICVALAVLVISIDTPNWIFISFPNKNGTYTVKVHLGYFQVCKMNGLGNKLLTVPPVCFLFNAIQKYFIETISITVKLSC